MPGRVTPHSARKVAGAILLSMRIKQKDAMTFGDLITAAYQVWGPGQAEKMVRLAIHTRRVVFREPPHFFISLVKGRSL
jgi:hypothetical protein